MSSSPPFTPDDPSRLLAPLTLGAPARAAGWLLVAMATVVLSRPLATPLLATDAEELGPALERAIGIGQLLTGSAGLALLALASTRLARRRLPLQWGQAVLLTLAAVFAFVAAEVGLRVYERSRWGSAWSLPWDVAKIRPSEQWNLRPGRYAATIASDFDPAHRRYAFFSINRYGLRGSPPEEAPTPGRWRIICLGGSSTFGMTVTDGEEWPRRLEDRLGAARVEVINAGRPGATTWSDFRYLRDRVLGLRPDVVVFYEGFNDLWRGVRRHDAEQPDYGLADPKAPPAEEALDLGPPRPWAPRASFLAYRLARKVEVLFEDEAKRGRGRPHTGRFRFDPAIVGIYERNLAAMVRLVRARGARPVVVTFAGADDPALPEDALRVRLGYVLRHMPQLDLDTAREGMALYRDATRRVAAQEAAPLIDAAAGVEPRTGYYTDTIHFTAAGEDRLAAVVSEGLRPLLTDSAASR